MAAPPGRTRIRERIRKRVSRRTTRRLCAALAAGVALLPLTACGGVSVAGDRGQTFSTMGFGLSDAIATSRIDDARKALAPSGLKLQINEGAFDEQQFLSSVAAGDPPDVVNMDRTYLGGYAARGALLPLTECLKKKRVDLSTYQKSAVDEATLDGTVYGMPDSMDSRILLMDRTVLRRAGYGPDDVDTSKPEQLRELTRQLKQQQGGRLTRIGFDPKIPEFFPLWVRAHGGSLLSEDGKRARLDSEPVVEALEYTSGLIEAQGGWGRFKALRDTFDQFGEQNQIAKHQVAAYPMEDWYVSVLGDTSPDVDLASGFMKDPRGRTVNYVSGTGWAIPKGSRHVDEACTFITSMTSTKSWVKAARAKAKDTRSRDAAYTGDWTGNLEADRIIEKEVWRPTGRKGFDDATQRLFDIQDEGFAVPANAAGPEFKQAWLNACNQVLSGDLTPRQALERAQSKAQAALDLADQERR